MAKLTIEERLNLLEEAEIFFSDLSDAGEQSYKLGIRKASALWTVLKWLELYQDKMLNGDEWTEETLAAGLDLVIRPETIDEMVKTFDIDGQEESFYKGWFGLAIGILEWDEKTINDFKDLQKQYEEVLECKVANKTLADLLK